MYTIRYSWQNILQDTETVYDEDGGHVLARQAAGRWEARGEDYTAHITSHNI